MPYSNAAKTRNPLKFVGVPQTTGWISAVSRPKYADIQSAAAEIRRRKKEEGRRTNNSMKI